MYFTIDSLPYGVVVKCDGKLNAASVTDFRDTVESFIINYKGTVFVDLAMVDFVSSAGIRAFLLMYRTADETAKKYKVNINDVVKLINMRPEIKEVLDMSGLTDTIDNMTE
ncbi:MAG: STAS domain-containing protein [Ignavibacteriaceae bacterium]|nr:STAS domain-containing protein [Ignavibacteriaceae bacterium]NUM69695.1 STAS domain-containing protein [Ignavibacteriaceae bacterium]